MNKPTPGPWRVTEDTRGRLFVVGDGEDERRWSLAHVFDTLGNSDANARAIAALPALLAVCERIAGADDDDEFGQGGFLSHALRHELRAALDQARELPAAEDPFGAAGS